MRAVRVHRFGGPEVLRVEELPTPSPGPGEILVRVIAAGVGLWDAWVRQGRSAIPQTLPLTPGADIAGFVGALGAGVTGLTTGDAVFGVTNAQFTGAYAEYAIASADMLAPKPPHLPFVQAAAAPVVGCTAWQMAFEFGRVGPSTRVLIHGGAGNVGALAVQLVRAVTRDVIVTTRAQDVAFVQKLGVEQVIDVESARFEDVVRDVDVVLDTVGGEMQARSYAVMRTGGVLVSSAANPDKRLAAHHRVEAAFFLVSVTSDKLAAIGQLLETGKLAVRVGEVVPLADVRHAHAMLAGAPHRAGRIVLTTNPGPSV